MGNRQQRRAEQRYMRSAKGLKDIDNRIKGLDKEIDSYQKARKQVESLTEKDVVQNAYKTGYKDGSQDASWKIIRSYYSATMMALNELFGFGQERCLRTLRRVEECLIECLTDTELVESVEKRLGIEIDMDEGINRAQPMEKGNAKD